MRSIHDYDLYIFDCDGVILNSNKLKIEAMESTLTSLSFEQGAIAQCVDYFSRNFGKSRFHHVDVFLEEFLTLRDGEKDSAKSDILELFSDQCKSLYLEASITPGFETFIQSLSGNKYVASGSEQNELREVFSKRGLNPYFVEVFGSPTKKSVLVDNILNRGGHQRAIMFGDALSDLQAAQDNEIDFIAYTPFSNVREDLIQRAEALSQTVIDDWSELT